MILKWKNKKYQKARELLYRSFEVPLSAKEENELDSALRQWKVLEKEQQKIKQMRGIISNEATRSFGPFFADRVMQRIRVGKKQYEANGDFFESFIWSFRPIAFGGILVVLLLIGYNVLQTKEISLKNIFAIPQLTLEKTVHLNEFTEREEL